MDIHIRQFDFHRDLRPVRDLWANAGPGIHLGKSDTPDELFKKFQHDPALFLVAEADNTIIGAVIGGFDGRRGMIYHLAVVPAYRRKGIGNQLMAELEDRLKAKGCIRSYLMVVHGNQTAADFYSGLGWELMDGIDTYAKDL